jgi:hypothetical protein
VSAGGEKCRPIDWARLAAPPSAIRLPPYFAGGASAVRVYDPGGTANEALHVRGEPELPPQAATPGPIAKAPLTFDDPVRTPAVSGDMNRGLR